MMNHPSTLRSGLGLGCRRHVDDGLDRFPKHPFYMVYWWLILGLCASTFISFIEISFRTVLYGISIDDCYQSPWTSILY